MNDKRKPIEERIAEMFGRTAYRDVRDGFGAAPFAVSDVSAIPRALGAVAKEWGNLVAMVLETKYGCTLMHEKELCAGWAMFAKKADPTMDRETVAFARRACIVAVYQLATGKKVSRSLMEREAWSVQTRREAFEAAVWLIASWFDDLENIGLRALHALDKEAA